MLDPDGLFTPAVGLRRDPVGTADRRPSIVIADLIQDLSRLRARDDVNDRLGLVRLDGRLGQPHRILAQIGGGEQPGLTAEGEHDRQRRPPGAEG